jgi:lipoyl(octanoyl) transferase
MSVDRDKTGAGGLALAEGALEAYLLGTLEFDAALKLQRRLHYEITGERQRAALFVCEHPPLISVGRQGSRSQILWEPRELQTRRWPIRWVNRGGGCWLHLPGQFNVYAVVPLDRLGLSVRDYLETLGKVVTQTLGDFDIPAEVRDGGVWIKSRMVAALGVAIRDWVSYYGFCLNAHPDLDPFRLVRCSRHSTDAMTSLERERRGRVRPAMVRERLVEKFQTVFGFERLSLFTDHPSLGEKKPRPRRSDAALRPWSTQPN